MGGWQDEYDHGSQIHEYARQQPTSNDEGEFREQGGGTFLALPRARPGPGRTGGRGRLDSMTPEALRRR
jgi:hypothetical protein